MRDSRTSSGTNGTWRENGGCQTGRIPVSGRRQGRKIACDGDGRQGKRVAVIERGMIGGSCINVACIPSKALIHRARRICMAGCVATGGGGHGGRFRVCRVGRERMVDVNRRAFEQSGLELAIGTGGSSRREPSRCAPSTDRNDLRGRERLYQHGYGRVVPGRAGAARRAAAHARGGVATDDASRASGRHRRRLYRAGDGSSLSAARQRGHARQRYAARCDARRRGCQYGHSAGPDRRRYSARTAARLVDVQEKRRARHGAAGRRPCHRRLARARGDRAHAADGRHQPPPASRRTSAGSSRSTIGSRRLRNARGRSARSRHADVHACRSTTTAC